MAEALQRRQRSRIGSGAETAEFGRESDQRRRLARHHPQVGRLVHRFHPLEGHIEVLTLGERAGRFGEVAQRLQREGVGEGEEAFAG